jgi:hypothetical protein
VLVAIELIAALYVAFFAWFWSQCQMSISDEMKTDPADEGSNLIPFERGLELNLEKKARA